MYNPKSESLDIEYFPSYHTTRFQDQPEPNIAVLEHFIRLTQQRKHVGILLKDQYLRVILQMKRT